MKNLHLSLLFITLFAGTSLMAATNMPSKTVSKTDSTVKSEVLPDDVVAMDVMREFKSLSRVDRKMSLSEAKTAFKEYKKTKASGGDVSTNTLLLVILAILLPPLAVGLHENALNCKFWLDLLLTLLFYLPGMIYALIVVLG